MHVSIRDGEVFLDGTPQGKVGTAEATEHLKAFFPYIENAGELYRKVERPTCCPRCGSMERVEVAKLMGVETAYCKSCLLDLLVQDGKVTDRRGRRCVALVNIVTMEVVTYIGQEQMKVAKTVPVKALRVYGPVPKVLRIFTGHEIRQKCGLEV